MIAFTVNHRKYFAKRIFVLKDILREPKIFKDNRLDFKIDSRGRSLTSTPRVVITSPSDSEIKSTSPVDMETVTC